MARPDRRDAVRPAQDQRRDLGDRLVLPGDESWPLGQLDRGDQLGLLALSESRDGEIERCGGGAIVCIGRRLCDPEANRLAGLASGARGAPAGANRPTSALARVQPSAVRASGF